MVDTVYLKMLDGLLRLHQLRIDGKHDSDEADLVRDGLNTDPDFDGVRETPKFKQFVEGARAITP